MNEQQTKVNPISSIVDYIELFAIAICVVMVIFSGIFRLCTVDGDSMKNTLYNGEVLIVSDVLYTPDRGDIVIFHQSGGTNKPLVKRVIGLGGDKVTIDYSTWTVTINEGDESFVLEEKYRFIDPNRASYFSGIHEYNVPEGSLFVMGDNRNNSLDSRFSGVGYVDTRSVLGRVVLRLTPLSSFGTVD